MHLVATPCHQKHPHQTVGYKGCGNLKLSLTSHADMTKKKNHHHEYVYTSGKTPRYLEGGWVMCG